MAQLFSNNATSTLNGAIAVNTMSITLNAGDGAKFPSPTNGDFFLFTMFQHVNGFEANWEVASCIGRTGDVLTVGARGLENTSPLAYNNGEYIELRFTAGAAGSLAPKNSPVLTTPTLAASPAQSDSSLAVASTAFVQAAVNGAQTINVSGGSNIVLTAAQAAAQILIYTGVLTANITVAVPAAAKTFTVVNQTTGAFTLTQIAFGGTGIAVSQGYSQELLCNGTNVVLASSDLAGAGIMPAVAPGAAGNVIQSNGSGQWVSGPGGVSWIPINSATTAVAGGAYDCDTTNGGFPLTLPPNPSVNQVVMFCNSKGTFAKNNLTLALNGANFMWSSPGTVTASTNYLPVKLTYLGASQGWCLT